MNNKLDTLVHGAVDRCNPTSNGERVCLFNIIERAVKIAYSAAIEDAAKRVDATDIAAAIRALAPQKRTEPPAPKCDDCGIEMDLVGTIDRHDGQTWHCSQCGWSWP